MRITSPHNPRIKSALRLRDHRHRQRQERLLIDGLRELSRAVQAGIRVLEVFYDPDTLADRPPMARELLESLGHAGSELFEVSAPLLAKIGYGERDEGVVAVAARPERNLASLQVPPNPLVLVLEGVEKPGNVGAVLRTADAVGAALVLADARTDLFNPNAIRASLGAVFSVPACSTGSLAAREWLASQGCQMVAARVNAPRVYWEQDYTIPTAIVLGSETHGLSPQWDVAEVTAVSVPMLGVVDSLNVSVTAAVLAYEALRQRQPMSARRP